MLVITGVNQRMDLQTQGITSQLIVINSDTGMGVEVDVTEQQLQQVLYVLEGDTDEQLQEAHGNPTTTEPEPSPTRDTVSPELGSVLQI